MAARGSADKSVLRGRPRIGRGTAAAQAWSDNSHSRTHRSDLLVGPRSARATRGSLCSLDRRPAAEAETVSNLEGCSIPPGGRRGRGSSATAGRWQTFGGPPGCAVPAAARRIGALMWSFAVPPLQRALGGTPNGTAFSAYVRFRNAVEIQRVNDGVRLLGVATRGIRRCALDRRRSAITQDLSRVPRPVYVVIVAGTRYAATARLRLCRSPGIAFAL